jgi:dihydroflavonol-4-reductase
VCLAAARAEEALLAEAAPPELVICRIGEAYGHGDGRLVKVFKAVQKGIPCRIGKGGNLHQPIHVVDLVQGLLAAASRPGIAGECFVLAGPSVVDSRAMIDEIAAALHKKPPPALPMLPFKLAAIAMEATMPKLGLKPPLSRRRLDFFTKNLVFDLTRSRQQLAFEPRIDLTRGIRETCDWYRANGVV